MLSNYKRIGDYIELVDERNTDLSIDLLLGLTVEKRFIPSVANTVGTNMKNYKIIRKNQFACSTMQVRRDKKMPVAILKDFDKAIISQAYPIFQVVDETLLNPDYLMMWFTREEFDRQATFHAVGGVRGSLEWEDFLDFELPIPSIEKQREIVNEYNTVTRRIQLNEQLNQKLEATAQALYRHWFVDFEFPNEEGKPYKSSGGAMVYNEELDKEVPEGWEVKSLSEVAEISAGGDKPKVFSEQKTKENEIPIFSNGVTNNGLYGFTNKANYPKDSITISARGTIGFSVLRKEPFDAIVRLLVLTPKFNNLSIYLWHTIKLIEFDNSGSVQNQLTKPQIANIYILIASSNILEKYQSVENKFYKQINNQIKQSQLLANFQSVLLSKMSTVEERLENEKMGVG
ncbi:MAG TPA: restriction endonuclease subunit S [Aequorivita sp.]|nr:restriction endonuclease subunit S [Aequorivita sp.]